MQDIDSDLVQFSYNMIMISTIGPAILIRWGVTGVAPFIMIWTTKSALLLAISIISNLFAQQACFYANQKAQPSLVSLLAYQGIVYRAMADILIFGLIPNSLQICAISILIVIQVVHLIYKQLAQKRELQAKINEQKQLLIDDENRNQGGQTNA